MTVKKVSGEVQSSKVKWYTRTMVIETVPQFIFLAISLAGCWSLGARFQDWVNS